MENSIIINFHDHRCFQQLATTLQQLYLIIKKMEKNPQIIMNLYPFINKYNWYGINFPSEKDDWIKSEKINSTIVLNVLYEKEKEISATYISKYS